MRERNYTARRERFVSNRPRDPNPMSLLDAQQIRDIMVRRNCSKFAARLLHLMKQQCEQYGHGVSNNFLSMANVVKQK